MNLINIHSHILFGADDGARTLEDSIKLLDREYESGVRVICLTPHGYPKYPGGTAQVHKNAYAKLVKIANDRYRGLRLLLGQEVYYHSDCINKLMSGECLSLNNTRSVLVEFNPNESLSFIRKGLSSFLTAGFVPILAHAERYISFVKSKGAAAEFRDMGVLIQINSDTVNGKYGHFAKKFAFDMIKHGHADIIADDCHSLEGADSLCEAYKTVLRKFDENTARELFEKNPGKVLVSG